MRIKRRDTQGNFAIVEVADDYVLLDGEQAVVAEETQRTISQAEHEAMLTRVRTEEKSKLQSTIERERAAAAALREEREQLNTRLASLEQQSRERELEGLKPNERQAVELRNLQDQLAESQRNAVAREQQLQARLRATELTAYRERAIRAAGGHLITEMVRGGSEEEIDASVDASVVAYKDLQQQIRRQIETEFAARNPPIPVSQAPSAVVTPANPAYQQPVAPSVVSGFPSVANPEPVADASYSPINLSELTSEEAVRQGRWGGELRQQILSQLKGQKGSSVQLGSSPRHLVAAPQPGHVAMPSGVSQPVGNPTGPVSLPGYVPPAHPAPVAASGAGDRAAAAAAVARTHLGQNPVMQQNPGAAGALAAAQATGAQPSVAYAGRFAPSSPDSGQ